MTTASDASARIGRARNLARALGLGFEIRDGLFRLRWQDGLPSPDLTIEHLERTLAKVADTRITDGKMAEIALREWQEGKEK